MSLQIRRLCHWGPIAVLGIIKLITWSMVHLIGMWWPPQDSLGGALHAAMFLGLAATTLYNFMQAMLEGPGYVPLGWKPKNEADVEYLQFCTTCQGYKAPRSHHCRKCGYCIKKMDHHCPWINCCVGHANHKFFIQFLLAASFGCLHATIVQAVCLYHAVNRVWYVYHGSGAEPMVYLTLTTLLLALLATGMALGVVLAVGALLYFQISGVLRNQTTIEDWIVEKAASRHEELGLPPFVYPYHLGWRGNLRQLLRGPAQDGLQWPVAEGCGEYDLTMEQKAQKADKLVRSQLYEVAAPYSGRWLPVLSWPRAALAPPCTDEPRLTLARGDIVRATRRRRQWLFGERLTVGALPPAAGAPPPARGPRGWFPRACAAPARGKRE